VRSLRIFEATTEMKELGVGINTLPHGTRELASLRLLPELARVAIGTSMARSPRVSAAAAMIRPQPLERR
jgi:hypothetical protein